MTILDIIHQPAFYLKHDVSETQLCLRRQTSSTYWAQLSMFHLKTEAESSLRNILFQMKDRTMDMPRTVLVVLLYHRHKPIDLIYLYIFKARLEH
jgi:conjugal transfer/entry exclusion protein